MTRTMRSLGIDRLTIDQQVALVEEIRGSIREEGPPPLSDAKMQELERRWAETEADPEGGTLWEQAKAELLEALDRRRTG